MIDDTFLFVPEDNRDTTAPLSTSIAAWHILIVDDDLDVHKVTHMVFHNWTVQGRSLHFTSAYSGNEVFTLLKEYSSVPDLILMDMMMDTPTDGVDTVHRIRNELGLKELPVIIIRTGQPGLMSMSELQNDKDIDLIIKKTNVRPTEFKNYVEAALTQGRQGLKELNLIQPED